MLEHLANKLSSSIVELGLRVDCGGKSVWFSSSPCLATLYTYKPIYLGFFCPFQSLPYLSITFWHLPECSLGFLAHPKQHMLLCNIRTINNMALAYIQPHPPVPYTCVAWYSRQAL
jgi:hypothetical protein